MLLTSNELMFLSSIVSNKKPFGIVYEKIKEADSRSYAKQAKEGLIKKGILEDGSFTDYGGAFMLLWEKYIEAEKYVLIDGCIIAVLDGRRCVAVARTSEGYEISSGDISFLVLACLKNYEVLRRANKEINQEISTIDYGSFIDDVNSHGNNFFSIGIVKQSNGEVDERIFYWDSTTLKAYNPSTRENVEVNPSYARTFIGEGLGYSLEEK